MLSLSLSLSLSLPSVRTGKKLVRVSQSGMCIPGFEPVASYPGRVDRYVDDCVLLRVSDGLLGVIKFGIPVV